MGLIQALKGAVGSTFADQWKEYIYCDSLPTDVLMRKGAKRISGRSSNTKGSDNVITNGSIVAVNEGQCMIIVEQGKVVDLCAEAGAYKYDTSIAPSLFTGGLGKGIIDTFKTIGKRFTYGGDTGTDQRVYFINTKEIIGNKYGTLNPVPFRVVDRNIGLDVDIGIRCNGEYSYKVTNPILFYTNVAGNVTEDYGRQSIDSQLKSELLTALQPAFAKISEQGVRYSALPGHTFEIADNLNEVLSGKWRDLRGIEVASFGINSLSANEEDEKMIKELQSRAVLRDPTMAGATLVGAQAEAMKAAAANENGAMMGFMGLGMATQAGGMNASNLYAMGAQQQQQNMYQQAPQQQAPQGSWVCGKCGHTNTGNFCMECGEKKPAPQASGSWTCSCGTVNQGKFCMNCGAKRPENRTFQCDKCGWKPTDPNNIPKFCPNCGDRFDENDIK